MNYLIQLRNMPLSAAIDFHPTGRRDVKNTQSDQSPNVNIALVGSGSIGPRYAHFIERNEETKLCAIVNPGKQGRRVAAEFGVP